MVEPEVSIRKIFEKFPNIWKINFIFLSNPWINYKNQYFYVLANTNGNFKIFNSNQWHKKENQGYIKYVHVIYDENYK